MNNLIKQLKKGDRIEVLWEDAFGSGGWEESTQDPQPLFVASIGYFIKATKRGVIIATGLPANADDANNTILAPTFIPHGMVQAVRRVHPEKVKK